MEYKKSVKAYFKAKAKDYDLVETQFYWKLSDELLWYLLEKFALKKFKNKKIEVMDAGGGTGRWLIKIIKFLKHSNGTLYDFSDDMLNVAKSKIKKEKLDQRIKIVQGDLEALQSQKSSKYDLIICFHNVLGFVKKPSKVISELTRLLKKDGYLILVLPNKYHMLFFNIFRREFSELNQLVKKDIGRFTNQMPLMHVFTPNQLRSLYQKFGFKETKVLGFPVSIYPYFQETQIKGSSKDLKELLADHKSFESIKAAEISILNEEAASRGNNIFIIGKKK